MIDKMELSIKASQIRKKLGEDESSSIDIFALSQTIDSLTLMFYPLGKNISGACFKNSNSSIIAINSDMSLGRQRFSLAHELYHLFFVKISYPQYVQAKLPVKTKMKRRPTSLHHTS